MEKIFFEDDTFSATLHLTYVESSVFKTEAFITYELKNKSQFYSQLINFNCSSGQISIEEELLSTKAYGKGDKIKSSQKIKYARKLVNKSKSKLISELCI